MKSTPPNFLPNVDVLALMPKQCRRIIEIGPSVGSLAKAYRLENPEVEYVGVEIDAEYADLAREHCSRVIVGNVEQMSDDELSQIAPADCWVFSDVLEHLYDPWHMLRRLNKVMRSSDCIVACIPNVQHWSVQLRILSGDFWYEDSGLLDRTHIRFFTRKTLSQMFFKSGFEIHEARLRVLEFPEQENTLNKLRALADQLGLDSQECAEDATVFQYVIKADPR